MISCGFREQSFIILFYFYFVFVLYSMCMLYVVFKYLKNIIIIKIIIKSVPVVRLCISEYLNLF